MNFFGFEIKKKEKEGKSDIPSFVAPSNDDGALNLGTAVGGSYGMLIDMEGAAKTEAGLVSRYRNMSMEPELQMAIDEVVNEAINVSYDEEVVSIVLDDIEAADDVKKAITEEFYNMLDLLDFSNNAYELFRKWYIDGRINYHVMIDTNNTSDGIKELRYIDPRKIQLVREMEDKKDPKTGAVLKSIKNEYYVFSDDGFGTSINQSSGSKSSMISGIKIAKDSIVRITSGVLNSSNAVALSYIHQAMKPLNQLRMLEDATVIYTLTRAPERRVFYIDVGNLPKAKAEQYLNDMMVRHKNKVVYDSATGQINDDRRMMTMTEDFWFPRREGSRGTEIDTLPAGTGLGENENLRYFQQKLYKSLNVPLSRLQPEATYAFGRVSEMSREEIKFGKFVTRLRARFSGLFDGILEKQLILKNIITPEEWPAIKNAIRYDFNRDNYFEELKEIEIIRERFGVLRDIEDGVGRYISKAYVRTEILKQTEDDIKRIDKEIEDEKEDEPDMDAII